MYSVIASIAVIIITLTIIEIIWLKNDKGSVYKCLMMLPKNIVSSIIEWLHTMTHDNQLSSRTLDSDSEKNKQEENLIKVLAAASDSTNASLGDFAVFSICNFILMACGICISTMLFMLYIDEGNLVVENANNIPLLNSFITFLSFAYCQWHARFSERPHHWNRRIRQEEGKNGALHFKTRSILQTCKIWSRLYSSIWKEHLRLHSSTYNHRRFHWLFHNR